MGYTFKYGKDNSNWKGGPRHTNCLICNEHIETYDYKTKYCSRACYDISQVGRKQSEETKRKRSEAVIRFYDDKGRKQKVDLKKIRAWSSKEGKMKGYLEFTKKIK